MEMIFREATVVFQRFIGQQERREELRERERTTVAAANARWKTPTSKSEKNKAKEGQEKKQRTNSYGKKSSHYNLNGLLSEILERWTLYKPLLVDPRLSSADSKEFGSGCFHGTGTTKKKAEEEAAAKKKAEEEAAAKKKAEEEAAAKKKAEEEAAAKKKAEEEAAKKKAEEEAAAKKKAEEEAAAKEKAEEEAAAKKKAEEEAAAKKKAKEEEARRQRNLEREAEKLCHCSGHGTCKNRKPPCVCVDEYFGENCEHPPVREDENIPEGIDPVVFRNLAPDLQEAMREEYRKEVADDVVEEAKQKDKDEEKSKKVEEVVKREEDDEGTKHINVSEEVKKKVPIPPGIEDKETFSSLPYSIRQQIWKDHLKSESEKEKAAILSHISNRLKRIKKMKVLLDEETKGLEKALKNPLSYTPPPKVSHPPKSTKVDEVQVLLMKLTSSIESFDTASLASLHSSLSKFLSNQHYEL
eukprot:g200.t1